MMYTSFLSAYDLGVYGTRNNRIYQNNNRPNVSKCHKMLTDDNISKIQEIARKDALSNTLGSSEQKEFVGKCMSAVSPDRKKLFSNAQSEMERKVNSFIINRDTGFAGHDLWYYIGMILGNFDAKSTGVSGGYNGKINPDKSIAVEAKDENGDVVGVYYSNDPNGAKWRTVRTADELNVQKTLNDIYIDTFRQTQMMMKSESRSTGNLRKSMDISV